MRLLEKTTLIAATAMFAVLLIFQQIQIFCLWDIIARMAELQAECVQQQVVVHPIPHRTENPHDDGPAN